ncbi:MAG: caspase family protein, partial [Candidatus Obscuribacterales bacterium]|nr:caspase family protein [Candidatus Obscuribacterales bacterium]
SGQARRAYSTLSNSGETASAEEPMSGGKQTGFICDWYLLSQVEKDENLRKLIAEKAEGGSAQHQFALACMYFHGKGIEQNHKLALENLTKSAGTGHSNSQNNLGYMYQHGISVPADLKKALQWYTTAANFGNPSAQCNLGYLNEYGYGIPADLIQAVKLYQKAASGGNKVAKQNLYRYDFARRHGGIAFDDIRIVDGPALNELLRNAGLKNLLAYGEGVNEEVAAIEEVATAARQPGVEAESRSIAEPKDETVVVAKVDVATQKQELAVGKEKTKVIEKAEDEIAKTVSGAEDVPEKVAEPASPEVANSDSPELQAGSAKLTEILRRLSKGTSMQSSDDSQSAKASESAKSAESDVESDAESDREVAEIAEVVEDLEKVSSVQEKSEPEPESSRKAKSKVQDKPIELVRAKKAKKEVAEQEQKPVLAAKADIGKTAEPSKKVLEDDDSQSEKEPQSDKLARAEKPLSQPVAISNRNSQPEAQESANKTEVAKTEPAKTEKVKTEVAKEDESEAQKAQEILKAAQASGSAQFPMSDSSSRSLEEQIETLTRRPVRDKWALVVGLSKFENPAIPGLKYSAKDASDFYQYLVKEANFKPDHVRLFLDEKATQRRLLSELGSKFLARVVKPDDLVILYFSTHGSPGQLDVRGRNYLVTYDSDPDDLFATGIEMQKLLDSIQGRVLTDRVLLVLDACHSGFAGPTSKGMSRIGNFDAVELAQGSGQLVICSSQPSERSWESTRYENGVFTKKLLDGLRSQGERTTLVDAFRSAKAAVESEVREDRPGARQTPVLKGRWSGNDLIVSVPPQAPQEVPNSVRADLGEDSCLELVATKPADQPAKVMEQVGSLIDDGAKSAVDGVLCLNTKFFNIEGDPKSMAKEYYDAIKNDPSNAHLYFMRAKALIQTEDWHSALGALNDALQLRPNNAQYYLGRAYVHFRMNKNVLSREDLIQARFFDKRLTTKIKFSL